jgi:hypothetical protein
MSILSPSTSVGVPAGSEVALATGDLASAAQASGGAKWTTSRFGQGLAASRRYVYISLVPGDLFQSPKQ